MATTPPSTPPGGSSGPSRTDAQAAAELFQSVQAMAGVVREMADGFGKILMTMKDASKEVEGIRKRAKDTSSEFKQVATHTENLDDHFKSILDSQKKLVRDGLKVKSYKELQVILEEIQKTNKKMAESGFLSEEHTRTFKQKGAVLEDVLNKIKEKTKESFNAKHVEEMIKPLTAIEGKVVRLTTSFKGLRVSNLNKDLAYAERSVGKLLGRNWGRIEKFNQYAQAGHETKMLRKQRLEGRQEEFKQKRVEIAARLKAMGIDPGSYRKPVGVLRSKAFYDAHYDSSRAAGLSHRDARAFAKNAVSEAGGEKSGFFTRMAMNGMESGIGGAGARGILSRGANFLEGGAGGVMSMVAEAAPVLAVLDLVKDAFNKNVRMNSQVADSLSNGGIFGGQNDAITALGNVRSNLNGSVYSRQGIGYEKNLAIAKSISDNGMSVSNLSDTRLQTDRRGYVEGSFGTFQRNAYAFGRRAGLDPSQSTAETIKLISRYGQSLKDTEDFFIDLNKQSRVAGISATKYIELLDQINSQYDRQNQLLQTSVDTMRLLSNTGRETADNLKEAADAQTNGGKQQSLEQSAYLYMRTLQSPEMTKRLRDSRQLNFERAAESAASATGVDAKTLQEGFSKDGYVFISQQKQAAAEKFKGDSDALKAANSELTNLSTAGTRVNVLKGAMSKGGMAGGLAMATADQTMGNDLTSQSMRTLQGVLEALRQTGHTSDYLTGNTRASALGDTTLLKSLEALNIDPQKLNQGLAFLDDISATKIQMAKTGMTATDKETLTDSEYKSKQQTLEDIYDFAKKNGAVGLGSEKNKAASLASFANTEQGASQLAKILPQMATTFEDFYNSPILQKMMRPQVTAADREAALDDTAKLVASTRPTAEIFATAFTSLFNLLATPLNEISRILSFQFKGAASASMASGKQMEMIAGLDQSAKIPLALGTWDQHIKYLEQKRDSAKTEAERNKLDSEINGAKTKLTNAASAIDTYHSGQGIGSDQAQGIIDLVHSASKLAEAPKGLSEITTQEDRNKFVQSLFDQAGLKFNDNHMAEISANNLKMYQQQLQSIPGVSIATKKDAGGISHTYVTNNYNSVDMTQQGYDTHSAVNNSGQLAPSQPKPATSN